MGAREGDGSKRPLGERTRKADWRDDVLAHDASGRLRRSSVVDGDSDVCDLNMLARCSRRAFQIQKPARMSGDVGEMDILDLEL